jgi:hypothetical protein
MLNHSGAPLSIFQINLRKAQAPHHTLLNDLAFSDFDMLMIQEPYTYFIDDAWNTLSHPKWRLILPSTSPTDYNARPRSIIYMSSKISSNSFRIIPTGSPDITAIYFLTSINTLSFTFINLYNPPHCPSTLNSLDIFIQMHPEISADTPLSIMGDFNLHHPLWDHPDRPHRPDPDTDSLLTITLGYGLTLRSQPGVHTFHSSQGSTVIDLVFVTPSADNLYEACITSHSATHDVGSDHYPIIHRINLSPPHSPPPVCYNWDLTDWKRVSSELCRSLRRWKEPRGNHQDIDRAVNHLTSAMQQAISQHAVLARPSPHSKRWWKPEFRDLRTAVNQARRRFRQTQDPFDLEHWKELRKDWQYQIRHQKNKHWNEYLGEINDRNLFQAARYVTRRPVPQHIPPIKRPDGTLATTPEEQSIVFRNTFIPSTNAPITPTSQQPIYPPPLRFHTLAPSELDSEFTRMAPNKAPGPDGFPVRVLRFLWSEIRNPLFKIYTRCLQIGYYPKSWRTAISLILRKPKKPDYSLPNAYRPIALLCTMGKLLEAIIARRLSYLADQHGLLPNTHLGCRSGRSTEDGILTFTEFTKHEWRKGNVVGALLIDVKNAFPSVLRPRLLHNLKKRRIPGPIVNFINSFLSERTSSIKCSDFTSVQFPCNAGIPQGSPLSGILYLFYNADLLNITHVNISINSLGWVDDIIHYASGPTTQVIRRELEQSAVPQSLEWGTTSASALDTVKTQWAIYTRNRDKIDRTPLRFGEADIPLSDSAVYLGCTLDRELRFQQHGNQAASRAMGALGTLCSLARTNRGIPLRRFLRLITSCVHPRSDYSGGQTKSSQQLPIIGFA